MAKQLKTCAWNQRFPQGITQSSGKIDRGANAGEGTRSDIDRDRVQLGKLGTIGLQELCESGVLKLGMGLRRMIFKREDRTTDRTEREGRSQGAGGDSEKFHEKPKTREKSLNSAKAIRLISRTRPTCWAISSFRMLSGAPLINSIV